MPDLWTFACLTFHPLDVSVQFQALYTCSFIGTVTYNLPDNLPDKASPGETGSASRVTQTEIVYKVLTLCGLALRSTRMTRPRVQRTSP